MKLCRADITSKNNEKVTRFIKNFEKVEQKMIEVEEKDRVRNFQPPITGDEIIKMYNLPASKIIGDIKEEIKDAILDGKIKNDRVEALELLNAIALKKGITKPQQTTTK
jgi:poly(A) polymerase